MESNVWGCPFCGSPEAGTEALVHCSNEGCVLNRVDVPRAQWCTRAVEEDLQVSNDKLRDRLREQNVRLLEVSSKLRRMEEEQAKRLMEWRAKNGMPPHRTGRFARNTRILR